MAFLPSCATSFLVCPYLFGDVCQCFFLCTHPAHSSLSISIASSTSVCSVLVAIQLFCLCHCPSVTCCLAAAQPLPVVDPLSACCLFWFIPDVVPAVWFLHHHCCSARPVVWPSIYLCLVYLFSVVSVQSVSGVSRHVFSTLFVFQVVVGVFVTVAILVVCPPAAVCHPTHSGWFVWFGHISILISLFLSVPLWFPRTGRVLV